MRFDRRFLAAVLAALLPACASLPQDNGRPQVEQLAKERGRDVSRAGDARAAQELLASLGDRPLSAADAVRLALINNPRVKAIYAELGFAAADVYDAGRLSNPRLSASVLFPNVAGESSQVGLGLAQNFTDLLLLSRRSGLAQAEFARMQQAVSAAVLELAADVEVAYYEGVGAAQVATLRKAIAEASRVSAELAQRFFDAGNITRLQLSQEQASAAQATLDRLEAEAALVDERAKLNALMGLSENDRRWRLVPRLPAPLATDDALEELIRLADSRPDLTAARASVRLMADALGVTRTFRYLGDVELGVETERETDGSRLTGPTLGLELPIFNQGKGRTARGIAQLDLAEAELRSLEIAISNDTHRMQARVMNAKSRAEHYRAALIPLREAVVARTQEQVNFMLVGQFELLLAKQQEYEAYEGYLATVRDYWIARTELARAIGAELPSSRGPAGEALDAEEMTRPKGGGMQMEGMDHDMQQMDESGDGMKGMQHDMPGVAPSGDEMKEDAPASMPPPRKGEGPSDMPTGMESHIPKPADQSEPAPKKADPTKTQHGDHP